jgi:hypothetical protein
VCGPPVGGRHARSSESPSFSCARGAVKTLDREAPNPRVSSSLLSLALVEAGVEQRQLDDAAMRWG